MLDEAGVSAYGLSKRMGRSRTYIGRILQGGICPSSDRLAYIADAAGYDLLLRPRRGGEDIIISAGQED